MVLQKQVITYAYPWHTFSRNRRSILYGKKPWERNFSPNRVLPGWEPWTFRAVQPLKFFCSLVPARTYSPKMIAYKIMSPLRRDLNGSTQLSSARFASQTKPDRMDQRRKVLTSTSIRAVSPEMLQVSLAWFHHKIESFAKSCPFCREDILYHTCTGRHRRTYMFLTVRKYPLAVHTDRFFSDRDYGLSVLRSSSL